MSAHEARCPHCRAKAGLDEAPAVVVQEIDLPAAPTPIRVHNGDMPPFDCTLHPDGTLTVVLGGELRRNALTFDQMRERNWASAHFEINPAPLTEPEPAPAAASVVMQDVIPLTAA